MDFLGLKDKNVLVLGVANRRSVAFHIASLLVEVGAKPLFSVLGQEHKETVEKYFPGAPVAVCDVRSDSDIEAMASGFAKFAPIHGMVHSVAFADFSEGLKPFHETGRDDFLDAVNVSCYSLTALVRAFKPVMEEDGSIVTISISSTRMAAENYGCMAPVKAALDSSVVFLAKSMSGDTRVRVNAIGASPLKTSSSAGIPGYIKPYLFGEMATLRKKAVQTGEVADAAVYLLSPRSSGINAQTIIVDAGMGVNYFDKEIIDKST